MRIEARGHLIDAGILGKALDTVTGGGGTYHVESFEIGTTTEESTTHTDQPLRGGIPPEIQQKF